MFLLSFSCLSAQALDGSLRILDELLLQANQVKQSCDEQLKQINLNDNEQDRYAAQRIERQLTELQSLSLQLKKARIYTKNSNYREALQSLQRLESKMVALLVADQALEAYIELTGELQTLQQQAYQVWYARIDSLISEARSICLQAETSADLDPLMLQLAALEIKRPSATDNIVVTRGTEKLRGTVSALHIWMRYLDQRSSGNAKAANDFLKQLELNSSNFPLHTREELSQKWLKEEKAVSPEALAAQILSEVSTNSDSIMRAIERFEVAANDPKLNGAEYFLTDIIPKLTAFKEGFSQLEDKDYETARSLSKSISGNSGRTYLRPYFDALQKRLSHGVIALRLEQLTGQSIDAEQSIEAQIDKAIEQLWAEEKLLDIKELLQLKPVARNSDAWRLIHESQSAIKSYLTAQQFEEAGDVVSAYQDYRKALRYSGTEHPLNQLAIDAMKRLRETAPDQISRFDENALIEQMDLLYDALRKARLRRF